MAGASLPTNPTELKTQPAVTTATDESDFSRKRVNSSLLRLLNSDCMHSFVSCKFNEPRLGAVWDQCYGLSLLLTGAVLVPPSYCNKIP